MTTTTRSTRRIGAAAAALLIGLGLGTTAALANSAAGTTEALRFRVYLDRDPIGEHSFKVTPDRRPDGREVLSRASFDVNLLFFTAYRYRHESREQWRDGCLERIRSSTDDNGTAYDVAGERKSGALSLAVNGEPRRLPACVSTFAYWDRDFLKRPRLLNPQTGDFVDVAVTRTGTESRVVKGRRVEAERYRLKAEGLDISLWYTPEGQWIGLESDTGKGRTLRYERI